MVNVKTYEIKPTKLIPNSPYVLIQYSGFLLEKTKRQDFNPAIVYNIIRSNGWHPQWVSRYGATQGSHYHSSAHECMAVISGKGATLRLGAADTASDMEENTHGHGFKDGAVEVQAGMGDVFVIPAGVAHKTYDPQPPVKGEGKHMALGNGTMDIPSEGAREALRKVDISTNFMMLGAYPAGYDWNWAKGGDHVGKYEQIWSIPKPEKDPVLGDSPEGLIGLWGDSVRDVRTSKL